MGLQDIIKNSLYSYIAKDCTKVIKKAVKIAATKTTIYVRKQAKNGLMCFLALSAGYSTKQADYSTTNSASTASGQEARERFLQNRQAPIVQRTTLDEAIDIYLGRYDKTIRAEFSIKQICTYYGLAQHVLEQELERRKLEKRAVYYAAALEERIAESLRLRSEGITARVAAAQLGVSSSTIYRYWRTQAI